MKVTTKRRILVVLTLFGSIILAGVFASMKQPQAKKPPKDNALLVETLELNAETIQFKVDSQGTVKPRVNTTLSAEVSGRIIYLSDKFAAGGFFEADEVLLKIDPTDYQVALEQAKALVKQRDIEYKGTKKLNKSGYRAEAELASAEAALAAAKSSLVKARKNLERTQIRLPYRGMIREKSADLGQYVNPGSRLAVTYAIDQVEIRLPLTDQDLAFINLPLANHTSSVELPTVTLSAVQQGLVRNWQAQIVRTEGVVDESSRVTFAVAQVIDPYLFNKQSNGVTDQTVLPIGTFVNAKINGKQVPDLIRVPRSALRGQDELLFLDNENKLRIKKVGILKTDQTYAYINNGATSGDKIVITAIESPINGMQLRTSTDKPQPVVTEVQEEQ